jgi:hypothetical protein
MEASTQPQNIVIAILVTIVIIYSAILSGYLMQEDKPEETKQIGVGVAATSGVIGILLILLTLYIFVPQLRDLFKLVFMFSPYLIALAGVIASYVLLFGGNFDKESVNTIQKRMGIVLGLSVPILLITFGLLYNLIRVDPANTYYPFLYGLTFLNLLASSVALGGTYLAKSL